jgi:hypothetical protein
MTDTKKQSSEHLTAIAVAIAIAIAIDTVESEGRQIKQCE